MSIMSTFATILPAVIETAAPGVKCPADVADLVPAWLNISSMVLGCVPLVLVCAYYVFRSVSCSTVVDWSTGSFLLGLALVLLWFVGTDVHKVYSMRAAACGNN